MKEQFVTYEIALKLKELGFDEKCFKLFVDKALSYEWYNHVYNHSYKNYSNYQAAPLWQQAIDWFRTQHNIIIEVSPVYVNYAIGKCDIDCWISIIGSFNNIDEEYSSYEEAREQAILKAIEICQKNHS